MSKARSASEYVLIVALSMLASACRGDAIERRTMRHQDHPQGATELPPEVEAFAKELFASEYFAYVSSLKPSVVGKRVERSQAGHSGFALFFEDGSWVVAFLAKNRLEWQLGNGLLPMEVESLLESPQHGDAQPPLAVHDRPYATETCQIAVEVAKSHGKTIDALATGRDSFNFAFEDGHELDTCLVPARDGRLGLRVFWEQW